VRVVHSYLTHYEFKDLFHEILPPCANIKLQNKFLAYCFQCNNHFNMHLAQSLIACKTCSCNNRDIHKVRQTQHQNPEFDHTQGEIEKKPAKKYIRIQGGRGETQKTINFGGKLSFILSFLFPERFHCCYIYFHCSYLYNYYNPSICVVKDIQWTFTHNFFFQKQPFAQKNPGICIILKPFHISLRLA